MHHVFRLHPKQDLRREIENFCQVHNILAAGIVTCVGSLQHATLRMAGASETMTQSGPFEIVSLVGVYTQDGGHFHCSLSDKKGTVWGGHVGYGNTVYTTAEIILVELVDHILRREMDLETGYPELVVYPKAPIS